MLLTRAWWNHLLRSWNRPAGVPEAGPLAELAKNATRVPRTPRFVTALLLLASVAMVFVPDVREGMKATFKVWHVSAFNKEPNYQATVARLRTLGVQQHDPQAMAMVALLSDDRTERINMADQAVSLDPSLTWIYAYVQPSSGPGWSLTSPTPTEWLDKLQKWDPNNAFPRLLAAHQTDVRLSQAWAVSGYHGLYADAITKKLQQDEAWLAVMENALSEPRYDHYYPRLFDLYRSVAWRYGIRDNSVTQAVLFYRFKTFAVRQDVSSYSDLLEDRAAAAEKSGNFGEAERLYRIPAQFGERLAAQVHSDDDRLEWEMIEDGALRKLQPLLMKTGKAGEAALLGIRAESLQVERTTEGPDRMYSRIGNGWEGFMIRSFTAAIFILGLLSIVSFAVVFLRRRVPVESRGLGMSLASVSVDLCPLLLLFSVAGLYVAYRPVALVMDRYMTWPMPVYQFGGLWQALVTPEGSPQGIDWIFYHYLNPVTLWMSLIVALSMVAVYILLRGLLRKRVAIAS